MKEVKPRKPYGVGREALVGEVERLRKENQALLLTLRAQEERSHPLGERARELYRDGWSNRRISERLGIPLPEARRLTLPTCR